MSGENALPGFPPPPPPPPAAVQVLLFFLPPVSLRAAPPPPPPTPYTPAKAADTSGNLIYVNKRTTFEITIT